MLHNSGGYGTNEAPINPNPPLDLPQMSGPLNMGHNLQNVSGIGQQPPRVVSEHYNLPNYPTYEPQNMDIRSHFNSFANHRFKSFQTQYSQENTTSIPQTSWQNGMTPLNLNAQSTFVPNMFNFNTSYERRQQSCPIIPSSVRAHDIDETRPNFPQTPETRPETITSMQSNFFNTNQDRFSHFNQSFEPPQQGKLPFDVYKRKSLENTVKLIENILINTTSKESNNDEQRTETLEQNQQEESELSTENVSKTRSRSNSQSNPSSVETQEETNENQDNEVSEDDERNEIDVQETVKTKEDKRSVQTKKATEDSNNDTNSVDEYTFVITEPGVDPKNAVELEVKVEKDVEPFPVDIKMEPLDESDEDELELPFHKDLNGTERDDLTEDDIVISENSVQEATDVVKNGSSSDVYYECPHCKLLFKHPKRFLIHTKWHKFGLLNEKREIEAREKEEQKRQRSMTKMQVKVEKAIDEGNETYPCKDCSKIFCSKGSLKNHKARFHSSRVCECGVCGAVVLGAAALRAHSAAVHAQPYNCPTCLKTFTHKHSMVRHMETHIEEEEKKLPCGTCGKMFAVASRLKEHLKVHVRAEKGPAYRCSYCAKAFYQSYSLTIHERTHRNEKPFTCHICKSSYGTNSSLKRHLRVSHNRSKPFECKLCGRFFSSSRALTAHNNKLHPTEQDGDTKTKRRKRAGNKKPKDATKSQRATKTKKNKKRHDSEEEEEDVPID